MNVEGATVPPALRRGPGWSLHSQAPDRGLPMPSRNARPTQRHRVEGSGKVRYWLKTKNPKAAAVLRVQEGGW